MVTVEEINRRKEKEEEEERRKQSLLVQEEKEKKPVRVVDREVALERGSEAVGRRERALVQTGGDVEATRRLLEVQRLERGTERTPEEVNRNIETFQQAAEQTGVLEQPQPTEEIKGLFDTIGESQTFEAVKSGFIKADNIANASPQDLRNGLIRRGLLKGQIQEDLDKKFVELGFGSSIFSFFKGSVGKTVIGVLIAGAITKPIGVIADFDRKADTLNAAIPDLRERTTLITSNVDAGVYSFEQGLARLDDVEEKIAGLEYSIRLAARLSPTIKSTGKAEQIINRLDKAKEQLARERAKIFISQQQGIFKEATEEELVALLRRIQS